MVAGSTQVRAGWPDATEEPRWLVRYTLAAALVTVFGYSLGYSTIGFGLLLLGALAGLARLRRWPWSHTTLDIPLGVFAAILMVSAFASPYPGLAIGVTLMLLVSGAVYFGNFAWLLNVLPDVRGSLMRVWAAGAALAAAVGLVYGAAEHTAMVQGRAEIPHGVGPNGLGTTLMLGAILSLGLAMKRGGRQRTLWSGAAVICVAGLLASGSRASLVGWVAGTAYLVWRVLGARPWRMGALVVAGLIVFGGLAAASPQLTSRLPSTIRDVNGNRIRIWQTSLRMVADRPLLGTGFGTFERAYDQRRASGTSPEPFAFNLWLNLAVETGVLGVAAAVWVAVAAVLAWIRPGSRESGSTALPSDVPDLWRAAVAALWIALLVDQLADNTLFSISTSAALWLLLALTVGRRSNGSTDPGRTRRAPPFPCYSEMS
jgi:O-antigen ligase